MTPVAIATEDELSEAIAVVLIAEMTAACEVTHKLRRGGFGYLRSKMDSWRQMAAHQVMFVLTDLDRAECLVQFRREWLDGNQVPANLLLRVAVREVESWVLADHVALRRLIGSRGVIPHKPDELPDPKLVLLRLAKGAPRTVKQDLLRIAGGNVLQGLGYNARLIDWVQSEWSPKRAAERSPSLARARRRLHEAVNSFHKP